MSDQQTHDVLIIGSGAAGLSLALRLADICRVGLISKSRLSEGATLYAQGGISAVLDDCDSIESHVKDTLDAGAGLCKLKLVKRIVGQGKKNIEWLINQGIEFTRKANAIDEMDFHLHQEGGHSHRRIVHASDSTGKAIETTLEDKARQHPGIDLYEFHTAVDLITGKRLGESQDICRGAYIYDQQRDIVSVFRAKFVAIATGGAGKVYLYTSNPDVSTGDGIAMAWRAGCRITNMEFIQFHPTCLYHPRAKSFLISEALRGEGAHLLLANGQPFMKKYDSRGELAPRDIVARAIDNEMKRQGYDCVFLDISHKPKPFITEHFPSIYDKCREYGFDLSSDPIPVVPAAHYTCGGIMIDRYGRTDLPRLYAIGEASCSGLHGANRMASNSLLECVVYSQAAFEDIRDRLGDNTISEEIPEWDESQVTDSDEEVVVSHAWDEIRRFMWDYVGIVRTTKRLQRALSRVNLLSSEIQEYYGNFRLTHDLIELRNLICIAELVVRSALTRKESRGLHYSLDYPVANTDSPAKDTILRNPINLSDSTITN